MKNKKDKKSVKRFHFGIVNSILLILGIVLTIVGFSIMRTGDTAISTSILIITYVVIFPAAIMYKKNKKSIDNAE